MWVARDKKGNPASNEAKLNLFLIRPTRCEEGYWHTDDWEYPESECFYLPKEWMKNFEYLTWEDEPIEVELIPVLKTTKYNKLRKLAWNMYTSMQYLTTDTSSIRKAMEEFHHFICFEEKNYDNNTKG